MNYFDLFVVYKIVDLLSTPWEKTDAFKLGIIDDRGFVLIKRKNLKTGDQRKAYTMLHVLVWNLKRVLEKIPGGKSKIGSFAAAAWLLNEPMSKNAPEQP